MNIEELRTLAGEVAAELGEGWSARREAEWPYATLMHTDGRGLILDRHHDGLRLEIRGITPRPPAGVSETAISRNNPRPITVKADRGAEAIAREISRRLLPDYSEVFSGWRADMEEALQGAALAAEVTEKLAAILGVNPRRYVEHFSAGYGQVRFEVRDNGVHVNLNPAYVDADTALAIAQLLVDREKAAADTANGDGA